MELTSNKSDGPKSKIAPNASWSIYTFLEILLIPGGYRQNGNNNNKKKPSLIW